MSAVLVLTDAAIDVPAERCGCSTALKVAYVKQQNTYLLKVSQSQLNAGVCESHTMSIEIIESSHTVVYVHPSAFERDNRRPAREISMR